MQGLCVPLVAIVLRELYMPFPRADIDLFEPSTYASHLAHYGPARTREGNVKVAPSGCQRKSLDPLLACLTGGRPGSEMAGRSGLRGGTRFAHEGSGNILFNNKCSGEDDKGFLTWMSSEGRRGRRVWQELSASGRLLALVLASRPVCQPAFP